MVERRRRICLEASATTVQPVLPAHTFCCSAKAIWAVETPSGTLATMDVTWVTTTCVSAAMASRPTAATASAAAPRMPSMRLDARVCCAAAVGVILIEVAR
eukprot:6154921-Prymnesium_polylepis.1